MEKIKIFDTTLRDGEQSPGASLNKQEKLKIAEQLLDLNVDVIEAGFPIASQDDFEAVKLIAKNIKGPTICALARAKEKDIERAWEALKDAENPRIHVFMSTSEIHLKNQFNIGQEEALKISVEAVKLAKSLCEDIEFTPMDSTRTEKTFLYKVIEEVIKAGATTINISDTVGYSQPEEFGKLIKSIKENVEGIEGVDISVHCHNDLGLALANSLDAVKNGATQVECTVNGIGERAGNCALEEFVMNLKTRKNYFDTFTNIESKKLFQTSQLVSKLAGLKISRSKPLVGKNAFSHESGIHQQGILKNKLTYEVINSEDVGWQGESFVIGKHSGRHAVEQFLNKKGYCFDEEKIKQITLKIKHFADIKKNLLEKDIENVIKTI